MKNKFKIKIILVTGGTGTIGSDLVTQVLKYYPQEVIKTNIHGSQNVLEAALDKKVRLVVAISTDKVADPVNILGVSKLMMEKLFINTGLILSNRQTKFTCVRFGNVSWSNGSVLPTWKKQAGGKGVIKVTDKNMTRFMMSIEIAVGLILRAAELAQGGEVFILRMSSIKLEDLANIFLEKY